MLGLLFEESLKDFPEPIVKVYLGDIREESCT